MNSNGDCIRDQPIYTAVTNSEIPLKISLYFWMVFW